MNSNFDLCPPNPDAMIESIRSLGYDLGIAVADIIDNSISAGAKNVWISYKWRGDNTYISISDDGKGMSEDELFEAMRLGSMNPTQERNKEDLGRFGLGLKTASFSQCRKLTVASKTIESDFALRKWDLDVIVEEKEWKLLNDTDKESLDIITQIIKTNQSGTIVLWQHLDRLIESDEDELDVENLFYEKIAQLKKYLGMVFHRYIQSPDPLNIYISPKNISDGIKVKVKPWDPFLRSNPSAKEIGQENIHDSIKVTSYVLPHHSKFITNEQFNNAGGPYGWNRHQGFYVYRNKRLLLYGTWFNFYKQEDHYKLARIMIDIPNSMDSKWKINVNKTEVYPPDSLKKEIKRIAKLTREEASNIYRYRGKIDRRGNLEIKDYVWKRIKNRNGVSYKIDKTHPVVKSLLENLDKKNVMKLLELVEKTIPIETIIVSDREEPDAHLIKNNSLNKESLPILDWFSQYEELYINNLNMSEEEAFSKLIAVEPFNLYKNELLAIRGVKNENI